jgi:cell division protein FtsZ
VRRMTAVAGGRPAQRQVPTLDDLSVPTYLRQQRELAGRETHSREPMPSRRAVGDGIAHDDDSLLDIPAFLRRQAD